MKWITRENANVGRIASPWLIKRFVDPAAEFIYVPPDQVMVEAERQGAIHYRKNELETPMYDAFFAFFQQEVGRNHVP
jgi:hypothetical protein